MNNTILIAGPTASGKSGLAVSLAQAINGVIINADSMQVYRELSILTARPSPSDLEIIPHYLYGIISVTRPFSVGDWLSLVHAEIGKAHSAGQPVIIVGGTGLYFQALIEGIAAVPKISLAVRQAVRKRLSQHGSIRLHAALEIRDPIMAKRLKPTDSQRLVRAFEVIESTGISLATWQKTPKPGTALQLPWHGFVLTLPRETIYRRCDERLVTMLEHGALGEVAKLEAMNLDPQLPAMKALGIPDFIRFLRGEIDQAQALAAAQQATRRYAKRQLTWIRNKMCSWQPLNLQDYECNCDNFIPFIIQNLLTHSK